MTIEQQNVAIAEACGWHGIKTGYQATALGPIGMFGPTRGYQHIPNYVGDLNRMHEAEKALYRLKLNSWQEYTDQLQVVCAYPIYVATAAHRAKAFLCAIGKWVENQE